MTDPNTTNSNSSDPNMLQQMGGFLSDATVDTTLDGFVNQALDRVVSMVPGGQNFESVLNTGVDQNINNQVNAELNKGVSGIVQDIEGLFQ
jgi:hypothetical protein